MADFYVLNLWMFIVMGVLGYALCWFRWKLVWWILPVVFFVCVSYPFAHMRPDDTLDDYDSVTPFRVGLSMLVALAGPVFGALADYRNRHPGPDNLP